MDPKLIQFLASTELFGTLSPDALAQAAPLFKVQRSFTGVPLFEQGGDSDALYLVVSGAVEVRRKDLLTGMEFLLAVYGPGKSIGEEGVITDQPQPVSAATVEESVLLALPKHDLWRLMSAYADVGIGAARIMARRTNRFIAEKGVRFISLSKLQLEAGVVGSLPERLIREHQVMPVARKGKTLTVAMVNPHNLVAYDEVRRAAKGYYIEPVGVAESDFDRFMRLHMEQVVVASGQDEHVLPALPPRQHALRFFQEGHENINEGERRIDVQGEQVIAQLNQIIGDALMLDASDIHVEPSNDKIHVRYRIDGKLMRRADGIPMRFHSALVNRIKALASMDITERRKPLDGRVGLQFNNREISLRLSTVPTRFGENLVMRVLDKSNSLMSLDRIIMVPAVREMIRSLIFQPHGIVLVTGPTGSGKTTTLAAMVDQINAERSCMIVTIEDPIEFLHKDKNSVISQREIGFDTHSFAMALKHVLRQDPDVILIGELRDPETMQVALSAAETGHLVLGTLHTQGAAKSINRIIDSFPAHQQNQIRTQLGDTLQGVISQTLLRRAQTSGRVAATEVMVSTPAVANLIREGQVSQLYSAMQTGTAFGMHTLDQNLRDLVAAGTVSKQEAAPLLTDPHFLDNVHVRPADLDAEAWADQSVLNSHAREWQAS